MHRTAAAAAVGAFLFAAVFLLASTATPQFLWTKYQPLGDNAGKNPVINGNYVHAFQLQSKYIVSYQLPSGNLSNSMFWSYTSPVMVGSSSGLLVIAGAPCTSTCSIYGINPLTNATVWSKVSLYDSAFSKAVVNPSGTTVVFATTSNSIYALNAADGTALWSKTPGPSHYGESMATSDTYVAIAQNAKSAPYSIDVARLSDGVIVCTAGGSGKVYGTEATFAIYGDYLVAGDQYRNSNNGSVDVYSISTCSLLWTQSGLNLTPNLATTVAVANGVVLAAAYYGSFNKGFVYAFNISNGNQLWNRNGTVSTYYGYNSIGMAGTFAVANYVDNKLDLTDPVSGVIFGNLTNLPGYTYPVQLTSSYGVAGSTYSSSASVTAFINPANPGTAAATSTSTSSSASGGSTGGVSTSGGSGGATGGVASSSAPSTTTAGGPSSGNSASAASNVVSFIANAF